MKFKSLLLVVGFIPALTMAEIAKPAPEKPPPVVAKPAVVTHVYHYHYHYGKMPRMMPPEMMLPGMMPPEMEGENVQRIVPLPKGEVKAWDVQTQSAIIIHLPPPPSLGCY